MKKVLIFDTMSILYRTYFASSYKSDEITDAGLALHEAIITLNKYFKKYKPDKIIAAFDRPSWRKQLTKEDDSFDFIYKGSRRSKMTPLERKKFEAFMDHIKRFETMFDQYTSIASLSADLCEGDDLVAYCANRIVEDHQADVVIVTGDSDLAQLATAKITVINAKNGKPFDLKKYDNNPQYYLFRKCIRGDSSDDIPSAYPRVREPKIKQAWEDPYEREALMEQEITVGDKTYKVKDRYEQNKLLIDLTAQPEPIIDLMKDLYDKKVVDSGKYSHFHMLKFCSEYKLEKIKEQLTQYARMLGV